MKKIIILSSSMLALSMLSGCATQQPPVVKVDQEPILVGIPIGERVARSSKTINEQLDLLNKINEKKFVGTYELVEHNNGLDARKGSSRTIPASYNERESAREREKEQAEAATQQNVVEVKDNNSLIAKLEQKVKRIEWNSNSANELGRMFANSLHYDFVVSGKEDVDVSLKIENETLGTAIEKYQAALGKHATVKIIEKNKTFNVIYKK